MSRKIRVKLDFTLVLDHDVQGIDETWSQIPWAMTVAKAYAKKLGIVEVTKATRTLFVVDAKGKVVT